LTLSEWKERWKPTRQNSVYGPLDFLLVGKAAPAYCAV
jgi:hypothetical protein